MTRQTLSSLISMVAVLALVNGCQENQRDLGSKEDSDQNKNLAPYGTTLLHSGEILFEGSCYFLATNSIYGCSDGRPLFTCDYNCSNGYSCDDNDHWMAVPSWIFNSSAPCGTRMTICANGSCTWAYVRDKSCCGVYEVSPGILNVLGLPHATISGEVYLGESSSAPKSGPVACERGEYDYSNGHQCDWSNVVENGVQFDQFNGRYYDRYFAKNPEQCGQSHVLSRASDGDWVCKTHRPNTPLPCSGAGSYKGVACRDGNNGYGGEYCDEYWNADCSSSYLNCLDPAIYPKAAKGGEWCMTDYWLSRAKK